jgi:hypothetical protein
MTGGHQVLYNVSMQMVGWSVSQLVGWSVSQVVGWSVGRFVFRLPDCLTNRPLHYGGLVNQEKFTF